MEVCSDQPQWEHLLVVRLGHCMEQNLRPLAFLLNAVAVELHLLFCAIAETDCRHLLIEAVHEPPCVASVWFGVNVGPHQIGGREVLVVAEVFFLRSTAAQETRLGEHPDQNQIEAQ